MKCASIRPACQSKYVHIKILLFCVGHYGDLMSLLPLVLLCYAIFSVCIVAYVNVVKIYLPMLKRYLNMETSVTDLR